jgi:hypothetical protein
MLTVDRHQAEGHSLLGFGPGRITGLASSISQREVAAQDLDPAKGSSEPLATEAVEIERHQPLPIGLAEVGRFPALEQDPKRRLGVLGDAPLGPDRRFRGEPEGGSGPWCHRMIALTWARATIVTSKK